MSFSSEPALILAGAGGIVEAAIVLAVSFGVPIDADQKAAINALVTVVIALLTGIAIRSQVTPVARVPAPPDPAIPSAVLPTPAAPLDTLPHG